MALNFIQQRIQRSMFEAIRIVLVNEGYLPDITNSQYTDNEAGDTLWQADIKAIADGANKFAIELFGASSNLSKGLKKTPRITIQPKRIIPGDIGFDVYTGGYRKDESDPNNWVKFKPPFNTSNFQIDIRLAGTSADQDIVLNAVLQNALGTLKYIPLYDDPLTPFLVEQYDFQDFIDESEGIEEKVYSYQINDLVLSDEEKVPVALITEITVDTTITALETLITQTGTAIGPYVNDDDLVVNLSGINFNP